MLKKATSVFVALSTAVVMLAAVVAPAPAQAQSVTELQAMINQLMAQIAALQGGQTGGSTAMPAFERNLTIGSTGADVTNLQTLLEQKGFLVMPAGVAKGYFGSLTKKAVMAWQASVGLPATGYFGAMSRGQVNAELATPVVPPTTVPPTTTTPPVTQDGSDGSLTVSLNSYVGSGTQIKKGETKDMIALKLQATAGQVAVTRFDVRFNKRPWLYFSKITLKDTNGTVIAEKSISGASDATEVTVGSDYMVRFDDVNYSVAPGSDKIVVVSGTVLPTTDKLGSDVSVTVSVPANSIRTVNGKGYTDSLGDSSFTRTVTLLSTGSTANVAVRISPSTPAQRIVTTSTNGTTNDVVLGSFDFKAENTSATLNTLKFTLNDNAGNVAWSSILKNIRLYDGSTVYNVDSVATTSTFSNLTIDLPFDSWKTLTLKADVADQDDFTSGAKASTSITVNTTNVVGIDNNFNTVTASGGNTAISNDITFLASGVSVSNLSSSFTPYSNSDTGGGVIFKFTLNNTSNNDVYVSKTPGVLVATSTTGSVGSPVAASSTLTSLTASPASQAGDGSSYYVIPSGTSRSLELTGSLDNTNGTNGLRVFSISTIYFDDDTTGLTEFNINFGLENLRVAPTLKSA